MINNISKNDNKQKNKWENAIPPNYTAYLEKRLLYCRRINPTVSPEAQTILSTFYEGIAQKSGSPRLRENYQQYSLFAVSI